MANLSIKSRLLMMLLGVSAISIAIVASLSYYASYNALRDSVFNHLTSLRAIKAQNIEGYFKSLELEAAGIAEGPFTQMAAGEFIQAYRELKDIGENPEWDAQLETYYAEEFIPKLTKRVEGTPTVAAHLPRTPTARYLQYRYMAANPFPVKAKQQLTEIPDDNAYARAHTRHHPQFRRMAEKLGYYDLYIIDIETGDIVYTVDKEEDFASNLIDGSYDTSNLAELFRRIQRTPDQGVVQMVDYARYRPSNSRSQAFVATPIFVDGKAIAVLALQISSKEVKQVMTGGGHWERDGLGKTGETILIGDDELMRSHSRFLIEDPEVYASDMRAFNMEEAKIERMLEFGSSILIQPVPTLATEEALQGRTGTGVIEDYRGQDILASWAPLDISDFRWAIIAKMDLDEAFAPMRKLARGMLIQAALIMLAITLIVMLLASSFVRPVNELISRVRQAGLGEDDVQIDTTAKDEIGDLARSFKVMVESVRDQTQLAQETNRENERLLQSVLPESIARRLKSGEKNIADSVPDVSVLFADLGGFTQFCDSVPAHESVALLNELVSTFDDATGRFAIEKIKTFGDTYMAACGLCTPLLDHTRRAIDFAREMHRVVRRFNAEHALDLRLTVGISAGPVVAGIVGRDKFIYDIWGDTVLQADLARERGSPGSIVVTTAVRDKVEDLYSFRRLEMADSGIPLWCLSEVEAKSA
jgi:class 3 adenylate cyclase